MTQASRAFDEGRACDAVLRYLERRAGASRASMRFPEAQGHAAPIELTVELGNQRFAFEHTGIEPFQGHTQLQATAPIVIHPIVESVAGKLPVHDDFELHVPFGAFARLGRHRLADVQAQLAQWVIQTAPTLEAAPLGRYDPRIQPSTLPGVPFPVKLHRLTGLVQPGTLRVNHLVSGNVESLRIDRLQAALEKKLPKLSHWKQLGYRTVLVLEQNDIQLTNVHLVTDALLKAEAHRTDIADEVYLVSSTIDPWRVHFVRVDQRTYFDLTDPEDRAWEVSPSSLRDITA